MSLYLSLFKTIEICLAFEERKKFVDLDKFSDGQWFEEAIGSFGSF